MYTIAGVNSAPFLPIPILEIELAYSNPSEIGMAFNGMGFRIIAFQGIEIRYEVPHILTYTVGILLGYNAQHNFM